MTLKPTVRRKQIPVPVEWQDSEWDLEVRIVQELHGLHELQRLHGGMRKEEFGVRNDCVKIWRCGLGLGYFPLTLTLSPSNGEKERRNECARPTRKSR
jgi:hypothetical protein